MLVSNEVLHEEMIQGLVRSPSFFFDITPTGQLTNKFSNDLGILDNTLGFSFVDLIEGPIVCTILLVNVFSIDLFFIIPGIAAILISLGTISYHSIRAAFMNPLDTLKYE